MLVMWGSTFAALAEPVIVIVGGDDKDNSEGQ